MTDECDSRPERLSEEAAQQLFARAVELDQVIDSSPTVAELRQIAREVGIKPEAFDLALREFTAAERSRAVTAQETPSFFGKLWRRLRSDDGKARTLVEVILANLAAAVFTWLLAAAFTRVGIGFGWQGMEIAILLANALGFAIARGFRARIAEIGLMGMAAFQVAELAMHLVFGIRAVQGGPTHFAVMIAGIVGAAAGWLAARARRSSPASAAPSTSSTAADEPPEPSASGDGWFARIRIASFLPARS